MMLFGTLRDHNSDHKQINNFSIKVYVTIYNAQLYKSMKTDQILWLNAVP